MYELRSARPGPDLRKSGPFASLRSVQGAAPLAPLRGYPCAHAGKVHPLRICTVPAGLKLNTVTLDRLPNIAGNLANLLGAYYTARNAGAWSNKAKAGNLKDFAKAINYLTEKGIATLEDLEAYLAAHREQTEAINAAMKTMSV